MKQLIIYTILIFSVLVSKAQTNNDHAAKNAFSVDTYDKFPPFPLLNLDSARVNSTQVLDDKKKTVVIYFSPICNHCQHLTEQITSNIKAFKNAKLLFVSSYSLSEIKDFVATYGLKKFKNISVMQDDQYKMVSFYKLRSLPGVYVYKEDGEMMQVMPDHFKIEDVIAKINE